jgi:septal ring factor EnvC (AmiA/AmiB activator)
LVGDTGSLLDASSLYFEIRKDGQPEDPVRWLKRQSQN